jgi:hypothetical protein
MAKLFPLLFVRFLRAKAPTSVGLVNCRKINQLSGLVDSKKRVAEFAAAAPNCTCEAEVCSEFSSAIVADIEVLSRFIFSPIHISESGRSTIKPSAFSYAETGGCSVQRESIATDQELGQWMAGYKHAQSGHLWQGVLTAKCLTVRNIKVSGAKRAAGVYDTAEKSNPSHAEIFHTEHVLEEDRLEIRRELMIAFNSNRLISPNVYRGGTLV